MIFYVATDAQGMRTLCKTQAEAKALDKDFQQLDIPTDKDGLRDALQELLTLADQASSTESQEAVNVPQTAVSEAEGVILKGTDITGMSHEERNAILFSDHVRFREMVENEWPNHPIAWRLDLAMLAMEEARKVLPWPPKETQTND